MITRLKRQKSKVCNCTYSKDDIIVQDGLALCPSDIAEMAQKGIPVSLPNKTSFDEAPALKRGEFTLDPMYERDMDRDALWEKSRRARNRIIDSIGPEKK